MKEDKSLLFSHSAPDSVSLGATQRYHQHSLTLSHMQRHLHTISSSGVIKKKTACTQEISISVSGNQHTVAEGGIVLFCTPSDRRLRGIHLDSLFMSYGAFQTLFYA